VLIHLQLFRQLTALLFQLLDGVFFLYPLFMFTYHGCRIILESDSCCVQDLCTGLLVRTGPRRHDSPRLLELDWLRLPSTTLVSRSSSSPASAFAASTSVTRILLVGGVSVSDTFPIRICLGYVSRCILKMQTHFVLDTCIRHVWARWDTAHPRSNFRPPPP